MNERLKMAVKITAEKAKLFFFLNLQKHFGNLLTNCELLKNFSVKNERHFVLRVSREYLRYDVNNHMPFFLLCQGFFLPMIFFIFD